MSTKPEVKDFKTVYKEAVAPSAVQAYTATSSSARINVTLSVPPAPSGPSASPISTSSSISRKSD